MSDKFKGLFNRPYNKFFKSPTDDKDKQPIKNITETASNDMHDAENQTKDNMAEEEAYKPVNRHNNLSATERKEKGEKFKQGVISESCPSGLNFRKEPIMSSEVIKVLYPGDEILFTDIDSKTSNWCKVKKDGYIGYCLSKYIVKVEPNYHS